MSRKQPTESKKITENYDLVKTQVRLGTPETVVELISRQMDLAGESRERILREGSVVRDMKGSVIPHPSIQVELAATKLIADLLGNAKYGRE